MDLNKLLGTKSLRQTLVQFVNLLLVVSGAYMAWKGASVVLNTESPIVVVLSGSMEPLFYRGDILFLHLPRHRDIKLGDVTVYKLHGKDIPIVHRVVKLHNQQLNLTGTAIEDDKATAAASLTDFLSLRHDTPKNGGDKSIKQYILTKGDNNQVDDRGLYNAKQEYLHREDMMGIVVGYIPYAGMFTIWMNDYPMLKFGLLAILGLYTLTSREGT
ncbi:hypothetical protein MP228_012790 [Amoeboaphelidium protococcarum]|nr:hypothetical protein MP228_012790 [Amoeboaphelidium protococcarum]